jgi:hypothetical protein
MANFRKNLQVFVYMQRFSISRRFTWGASETMMVMLEGRSFWPRTLHFSI